MSSTWPAVVSFIALFMAGIAVGLPDGRHQLDHQSQSHAYSGRQQPSWIHQRAAYTDKSQHWCYPHVDETRRWPGYPDNVLVHASSPSVRPIRVEYFKIPHKAVGLYSRHAATEEDDNTSTSSTFSAKKDKEREGEVVARVIGPEAYRPTYLADRSSGPGPVMLVAGQRP